MPDSNPASSLSPSKAPHMSLHKSKNNFAISQKFTEYLYNMIPVPVLKNTVDCFLTSYLVADLLDHSGKLLAEDHGLVGRGRQGKQRPAAHSRHDVLNVEGGGSHPHQHLLGTAGRPGRLAHLDILEDLKDRFKYSISGLACLISFPKFMTLRY